MENKKLHRWIYEKELKLMYDEYKPDKTFEEYKQEWIEMVVSTDRTPYIILDKDEENKNKQEETTDVHK